MNQINAIDLVSIYDTIYEFGSCVYLSTPITSGPIFNEWVKKNIFDKGSSEYRKSHYENVILKNEKIAEENLEKVSKFIGYQPIINPSKMQVGLSQEEYADFWSEFIRRFVKVIIFSDGWEFSKGCMLELSTALQCKIPLYSITLEPMSKEYCIGKIQSVKEFYMLHRYVLGLLNETDSYLSKV